MSFPLSERPVDPWERRETNHTGKFNNSSEKHGDEELQFVPSQQTILPIFWRLSQQLEERENLLGIIMVSKKW